jgi:hypothetical protein
VIYNQIEQGEWLIKSNFVLCGFAADAIHNVTLKAKHLGKDRDDDRGFSELCKSENDTTRLEDHDLIGGERCNVTQSPPPFLPCFPYRPVRLRKPGKLPSAHAFHSGP